MARRRGPAPAEGEPVRAGSGNERRDWHVSIQGLRAVAMTLVFINHLSRLLLNHDASVWLETVRQLGTVGTDLFFCIAGAFAYKSFVREGVTYWSYLKRRLRRVYPVYASMLLLYVMLEATVRTDPAPVAGRLAALVKNALLLPGLAGEVPIIDATWALDYIVAFYVISPLLFWPVRRLAPERRPAALAALLALGIGVSVWTGVYPLRVTLLLAGPLVWALHKARLPWQALALVTAIGIWLRIEVPASAFLRFGAALALVLAITLGALGGAPWWQRALSLKPVTVLGYRSYAFYLCHGLPILAFDRYLFGRLGGWELAAAALAAWLSALALTEIVHRSIEVPWSLGNRGGAVRQAVK